MTVTGSAYLGFPPGTTFSSRDTSARYLTHTELVDSHCTPTAQHLTGSGLPLHHSPPRQQECKKLPAISNHYLPGVTDPRSNHNLVGIWSSSVQSFRYVCLLRHNPGLVTKD